MMLKQTTSSDTPPGPRGLDIAKWLLRAKANSFKAFVELLHDYGESVRVPFSPKRAYYLFSSPEAVKYVLQDNHRNYKKAYTYDFLKPVVGNGLLTSDGDLWLRQRRLVAPMFHRQRVESFATTMSDATAGMLERWGRRGEGESFDVAEAMSELTLSIAGKILFNRDIGRESRWIGDAMLLLFRDVNQRIMSVFPVPRSVPTPHNRSVQGAIDNLEELVYGFIEERRGREDEFDDLLSMFMLAEDEESGERMDDVQIRDELMTFMIAGHETTSNLLSWALFLLSKHPDIRRRLEAEVDSVVSGEVPTFAEVAQLDFLGQIIDETLRLYPPAWTLEREPIEDDVIDGYHVPAGSVVAVYPYDRHRLRLS
jgi:cytochrome P450